MTHRRPVEAMKARAQEAAGWFTVQRTAVVASLALAAAGVGYAATALISAEHDTSAAAPLIRRDGFGVKAGSIAENLGGNSVDITFLQAGKCTFDNVDAHLTFRHGRVVGVSDYQVNPDLDLSVNNDPITSAAAADAKSVTVQNLAGLRHELPQLHC